MADSVLVLLVNQEEIRVIYTEKFQPGSLVSSMMDERPWSNQLGLEDLLVNRTFKATVEATQGSELETG